MGSRGTLMHVVGLGVFAGLAVACGLLVTATSSWVRGTILDSFGFTTGFVGVFLLVSLADILWTRLSADRKH